MGTGIRAAALPVVLATLGACAGGGGGGGGGVLAPAPLATEAPLTSFAAVPPNHTVVMEGKSATLTATVSADTVTFTSADATPIDTATVKFSYDSNRQLNGISVDTPQASFSFDRNAPGHELKCSGGGTCKAESPTALALALDPFVLGWNYQSFGVWAMESGPDSIKFGAISAGSPTSGSSLPTVGSATFNGLAAGFYIDGGGTLSGTWALMRADVNFGSRNILFSTSRTTRGNTPEEAKLGGTRDDGLNLSGTLSYAQGDNAFSGSLQTQNGQLSGQGAGRFFGPRAEEIGGVYSLQGTGASRMVGGFGGKR